MFAQIGCGFLLILKQGFLPDLKSKLFDFGFISFPWIEKLSNFIIIGPFNLTFDHLLFIFNLKLGVDLQGKLLSKYTVKFDNFGLFGILWLLAFYSYLNCKIWISFG